MSIPMNMQLFKRNTRVLMLCLWMLPAIPAVLVDKLEEAGNKIRTSREQIFVGVVEEKTRQLAELKKQLESFENETKKSIGTLKEDAERISGRQAALKNDIKKNKDDELLTKQLFVLNETYQVIQDIIRSRDQVHQVLELFIKEIVAFLSDVNFDAYKKENKLQERLYYSFEDLQKMNQRVMEQEKNVAQITEQEKNSKIELSALRRSLAVVLEQLKKKQVEMETVAQDDDGQVGDRFEHGSLGNPERHILFLRDLVQLYRYKLLLNEIRIQEVEYKIGLYAHQAFMAKSYYGLFQEYVQTIKPLVRVSEADIGYAKDELGKLKQEYYKIKEGYRQSIDKLQDELKKQEKRRESASANFNVALGRDIDDFSKDPAQTVDAYLSFCEVARINVGIPLVQLKIELFEAYIGLEDEKFNYSNLSIDVKESYYKIITRRLTSDDDIVHEIKQYAAPMADIKSKSLRYKEKLTQMGDLLSSKKIILDNIRQRRQDISKLKKTVFKAHQKEYQRCTELLAQSEQLIKDQIDVVSKLTGTYSGITSMIGNMGRLITFIKSELEAITIWYRPEHAISWQAVYSIPGDIKTFFADMGSYITRFSITKLRAKSVVEQIRNVLRQKHAGACVLKLILLLLMLIMVRAFLPKAVYFLLMLSNKYKGIGRSAILVGALVLRFVYHLFWGLWCWLSIYLFLSCNLVMDPYLYALFYLVSIPYMIFVVYRFTQFLEKFNIQYDYALLISSVQHRFISIFSVLVYSIIVLTFFKEAFTLVNYHKSELPRVLLAINFIIQVVLIFFVISKEQIVEFIPIYNAWWRWLRKNVDLYYYFFVFFIFFIVILSSPYLGYFRLVEYVFFAVIKTILLIIMLVTLYGFSKRIASRIFFLTETDIARERFVNAKTWFGFTIIILFMVICLVGLFISVTIWGWQLNIRDIANVLNEPLLGKGTATPITANSFLQIIGFIIAGFFVSYTLNRFVFDRIFDLLLVDMGVQHTVTRITHYIVITTAVFIGFQSVGLGQIVGFIIGALALSLGWVLKEPIGDFVSYFIILVQRPLKIGDYVSINEHMQGVVRQITPRAVILRCKNSTTIVVPNTTITTSSVTNWNYTRSFIALNDIELVIPFKEDPAQVQDILRKVVESHSTILRTPPVIVRLEEFCDYGYRFMVRAFVSSVYTLEMWNIASDLRIAMVKKLRENSIEIAVPMRIIQDRRIRDSIERDSMERDSMGSERADQNKN